MKILANCIPRSTFVKQDIESLRELGHKVTFVRPTLRIWKTWKFVKDTDLIFSWWPTDRSTGVIFLGKLFKKPIILTGSGRVVVQDPSIPSSYWRLHPLRRACIKYNLSSASIYLASSSFSNSECKKVAPNIRSIIVPLGIDRNVFRPRENFKNERIIATCCLLKPESIQVKGLSLLLDAFGIVSREFPDARLVFIGDDFGAKRILMSQIRKKQYKNVKFLEYSSFSSPEEYSNYLNRCALYVQFSAVETFGVALLEAMSSGVSVVVSNKGALPEIVGNNKMVVKEYSVEALAERISFILSDNKFRRSLARFCSNRARFFSKERRKDALEKIINILSKTIK